MNNVPHERSSAPSTPEVDPGATSNSPTLQELQRSLNRVADDINADLRKLGGGTSDPGVPVAVESPTLPLPNQEHHSGETAVRAAPADHHRPLTGLLASPDGGATARHVGKLWRPRSSVRLIVLLCLCVVAFGVASILWRSTRPLTQAGATSMLTVADTPTVPPVAISAATATFVPSGR